jgi:hypothetical protein
MSLKEQVFTGIRSKSGQRKFKPVHGHESKKLNN